MGKIHRYYLKEVAANAALAFTVLFGICLVSLVYRGIARAQGGDLLAAAWITFFWTADLLPNLLTIAFLFGTVLTFARASTDRELIALRASGVPNFTPMLPALSAGVGITLLCAFLVHEVIPWTHFAKYRVVADTTRQVLLNLGLQGDQILLAEWGGVMVWERKDERGHFHDATIHLSRARTSRDGRRLGEGTLFLVQEAWFEMDPARGNLVLALRGVREPLRDYATERLDLEFDFHELAEKGRRWEGDRDLTSGQLLAEVARGVHPNPGGARFTVHRRSCAAVLPLLLAPLGFVLGAMALGRGRVAALAACALPLGVYYLCDVAGIELVRKVDWAGFGWLPAMVLALLGAPFCWRHLRR